MIQKIGQRLEFNSTKNIAQKVNENKENSTQVAQNPIGQNSVNSKLLEKYYVSFGATSKRQSLQRDPDSTLSPLEKKAKILEQNFTEENIQLIDSAAKIAKEHGHKEITGLHLFKAALESLNQYIDDLNSGLKTYSSDSNYNLPNILERETTTGLFQKEKYRKIVKPLLESEIKVVDKALSELPKSKTENNKSKKSAPLKLASDVVNNAFALYSQVQSEGPAPFNDVMLLDSILDADAEKTDGIYNAFTYKLQEAMMLDKKKLSEKIHISTYDDRAKKILKNLSLGTNMFITYEDKSNPDFLVNSIENVFEKESSDADKLNKKNTKITFFNDVIKTDYFLKKAKLLAKDKSSNHIMIVNLNKALINSPVKVINSDGEVCISTGFSLLFRDFIKTPPKNMKFIFLQNKDSYYANINKPLYQELFGHYGEISFPILSTEQAKKAFREQPLLMKKIGEQNQKIEQVFSRKALDKTVEAAANLDGFYPEKAQKLMLLLSSYYIDKKEITEKDVTNYIEEAKDLFKTTKDESVIEVVFDTNKRLKDIIGKESTKKEATAIVKQIKNRTLGTKGAIIYSQDGSPGAGRRHTAKAIAGEAKAPYIEINAMDFGTKEVDLFGGGMTSPEASIKKLFSLVKTQAEVNSNKSAVLFIENFEYFSVGELVSEYHQKAMSQLLREMENAEKKGLNILVLGSVNDPEYIGETTMKSFKFNNSIEVASPARNVKAREEILTNYIKERKLKIAGETEAERQSTIKAVAETTERFPFIFILNLIDKAKTVATERGHKLLNKSDFTEAYLQITTGRPASRPISEHSKKIVTSHECGHALNLEVMWKLAETQESPWHIPNRVNFITLDPRGVFGGAMFPKDGGNDEASFETTFADLVCSYGGYSCENHFYNIDGSWGITGDLEQATEAANRAVQYMGQGPNTGKISLGGMYQAPSPRMKNKMDKDVDVFLNNSRIISDEITKVYADFNREFTEKYSHLVGTGDCLVQGDIFRNELKEWMARQPEEKLKEIKNLDEAILLTIQATKKGIKISQR